MDSLKHRPKEDNPEMMNPHRRGTIHPCLDLALSLRFCHKHCLISLAADHHTEGDSRASGVERRPGDRRHGAMPCRLPISGDLHEGTLTGLETLKGDTIYNGPRVLVFALSCLLDRWMYGSWVIVPLNFLKFNFLSAGGDYYGTHKWHWYITQGFPTIAFTFLPLTLHGIYKSKEWNVSCLIAWVLVIYSFLGHKEFRFVLPILPLALMFSGYSLAKMVLHSPTHKSQSKPHYLRSHRYSLRLLIVSLLLMTNLPVALYTCLIHQRGREDVMTYLAKKAHHGQQQQQEYVMTYLAKKAHHGRVKNILFLMPCHSTPYYSTLHYNLPMRFLDCSPSDKIGVLDESDRFKNDPFNFMLGMIANWSLPSHIVIFDHQEVQLRELLHSHSFNEEKRFFNAHFPAGDVLQAFVHVYYRKDR